MIFPWTWRNKWNSKLKTILVSASRRIWAVKRCDGVHFWWQASTMVFRCYLPMLFLTSCRLLDPVIKNNSKRSWHTKNDLKDEMKGKDSVLVNITCFEVDSFSSEYPAVRRCRNVIDSLLFVKRKYTCWFRLIYFGIPGRDMQRKLLYSGRDFTNRDVSLSCVKILRTFSGS